MSNSRPGRFTDIATGKRNGNISRTISRQSGNSQSRLSRIDHDDINTRAQIEKLDNSSGSLSKDASSIDHEHREEEEEEAIEQHENDDSESRNSSRSGDSLKQVPTRGSLHQTFSLGQFKTLDQSSTADKILISFEDGDKGNPFNWSRWKKISVLGTHILAVMNSTVASGLASNSSTFFGAEWGITSHALLVLPSSLFLLGYVVGPLVWGPMSEQYGRKYVMITAFVFYALWMLGCALAPNLTALVIFRFLSGVGAACPIVVVGGTCADIFKSPEARGKAMAVFMGATTFGPCAGPVISGYISPALSWRWSFWVGLIFAGVTLIPLLLVPETYGPIILKYRAGKLRRETGNEAICAPIELEKADLKHIASVVLTRPLRMFFSEAIVLLSCLYLGFAYGIFYMWFQALPIIFVDIYGFSLGEEGLTFLAIGVGALISTGIYLLWDSLTARARARNAPWIQQEEMRRLPLACLAGPFFVAAAFWLGWTSKASIHWIVPTISCGIYGIGYLLIFMALLNYLVDAYKIFAASAMAAASMCRSLFGAVLPFAARPMYNSLGVKWACGTLGFLSVGMAVIPFVFIWKGEAIRARSKFCQYLVEKEREDEEKRVRREAREVRRQKRAEMMTKMANGGVGEKSEVNDPDEKPRQEAPKTGEV